MKKILLIAVLAFFAKTDLSAQHWSALGSGINASVFRIVNSIANYNGEVYAGGEFTAAGGVAANNIAKWNGTSWAPVGSGTNGAVYSMLFYNGELYVGGDFTTAGSRAANHLAKWDGSNWSAVGNAETGSIRSMTIYNGELYAIGGFRLLGSPNAIAIAKWNGTNWSAVGTGIEQIINYRIDCLEVYNGELYVGGPWMGEGGQDQYFSIAKWDGTNWHNLNADPSGYVMDMVVYRGELYAAGNFVTIGGVNAEQIAKWDGTNWSAVGTGINFGTYSLGADGDGFGTTYVQSLAVYSGSLYAGGRFGGCGNIDTRCIASWDGAEWSGLGGGTGWIVYSLAAADTSLYVGGYFDFVDGINIPANRIAKWNLRCNAAPSTPDMIYGNSTVCSGGIFTYSIMPVDGAANYTWSLPAGWTGNSTSSSITTTAGPNGGNISVTANNNCGSSNTQVLVVAMGMTGPSQPIHINGPDSVCQNTVQSYSISPVPGALSYTWTLPPTTGWAGTSNTVSIDPSVGTNGGNISVTAHNACGNSIPQTLAVAIKPVPAQPGTIVSNGQAIMGLAITYSINPVSGATNYNWSLSGLGTIISGQGTTSISIKWLTDGKHLVTVSASNSCGTSNSQILTINASLPDVNNPFDIKITPNPTRGMFYIRARGASNKNIHIEIVNAIGQAIYHGGQRIGTDDYSELLNLENMAPGIYHAKIFINEKWYSRKIVKIN